VLFATDTHVSQSSWLRFLDPAYNRRGQLLTSRADVMPIALGERYLAKKGLNERTRGGTPSISRLPKRYYYQHSCGISREKQRQ